MPRTARIGTKQKGEGMKLLIQTLGQILYSPSQYAIPVFQRNYRWEQPQWDKLWNNVIEIQRPEKHGNHFMGFLVFVPGLAQPGAAHDLPPY